jgi:hypothetical protein
LRLFKGGSQLKTHLILGLALVGVGILWLWLGGLSLKKTQASGSTVGNQIHVISPYRQVLTWVFDDPAVGLKAEPFVSGIPAMTDTLVQSIPHFEQGFRLLFSATPFPGY